MFAVRSQSWCAATGLQGEQHGVDFGLAEYRLLKRLDIPDKADALSHISRHFGLESAAADEGDD